MFSQKLILRANVEAWKTDGIKLRIGMDRNKTIFNFSLINFDSNRDSSNQDFLFLRIEGKRRSEDLCLEINDMYMICRNFEIVPMMVGNRCSPWFFEAIFFLNVDLKGKKTRKIYRETDTIRTRRAKILQIIPIMNNNQDLENL